MVHIADNINNLKKNFHAVFNFPYEFLWLAWLSFEI